MSEVFSGTSVHDANVNPVSDHVRDVLKGDVAAGTGVIEAPVAVFADKDFAVLHGSSHPGQSKKVQKRA
jgi:hypothetical protein